MKAVLILDAAPESCLECMFCVEIGGSSISRHDKVVAAMRGYFLCMASRRMKDNPPLFEEIKCPDDERARFCPLKIVPRGEDGADHDKPCECEREIIDTSCLTRSRLFWENGAWYIETKAGRFDDANALIHGARYCPWCGCPLPDMEG